MTAIAADGRPTWQAAAEDSTEQDIERTKYENATREPVHLEVQRDVDFAGPDFLEERLQHSHFSVAKKTPAGRDSWELPPPTRRYLAIPWSCVQ
jgi:hypothetical protein